MKRKEREGAQERREEGRGEMSFIVCRHFALSFPPPLSAGRTESFRLARGGETIWRAICRVEWIGLDEVEERARRNGGGASERV